MVDLSDLPREITDVILSHLPLREAVRTSILSKNWRYKWTTVCDLIFKADRCKDWCSNDFPCEVKRVALNKIVSSINHVLSFHANPIWLFHAIDIPPNPDIDRWLLHLSRSSVRDLRLVLNSTNYVVPPSLYSCESLIRLELRRFSLKATPLSFNGFQFLKSLVLHSITLTDDAIERLISNCPLLEELTMDKCHGAHCLKINAPNLRSVMVYSNDFEDIRFEGIHARLSSVRAGFPPVKHDTTIVPTCTAQFFVNLPGIEDLEIDASFLKNSVAASFPPILLPAPLFRLHDLSIWIQLDDYREFCAALYLFRSSPGLRKLSIMLQMHSSPNFGVASRWSDGMVASNCTFRELRNFTVHYILMSQEDIEFAKFVLMNSPVLEELHIRCPIAETPYAKVIRRLDRASPDARVLVTFMSKAFMAPTF